jgi:hypothetical protein
MTLFLHVARALFSAQTVSAVFLPALADCQAELREAQSPLERLVTWSRWCGALAVLVLITPFSVSIPSITDRAPLTRTANGGWFLMVVYPSLFVGAWACFQEFTAAALVAGGLLAVVLRAWNDQHPASMVLPSPRGGTLLVQINLAKIPVTGDAAGLMFAAGTVVIVVVGLPGLWPYFAAVGLVGMLLAVARVRSGMCLSGRPVARIAFR